MSEPIIDDADVRRQVAFEEAMVGMRQEDLIDAITEAQLTHTEATTGYGSRLIREGVVPLAKFIHDDLSATHSGPKTIPQRLLTHLSNLQVAYIALRYSLDHLSEPMQLTSLGRKIGERIEWEARAVSQRNGDTDWQEWDNDNHIHVGVYLVGTIIDALGYFRREKRREGKRTTDFISTTEEVGRWVAEYIAKESYFRPTYLPMIVPPVDWSGPIGGGYLSHHVRPLKLVKMVWRSGPYFEELSAIDMPIVYSALNAMQRTAWRINRGVHAVVQAAWDKRVAVAHLPVREPKVLPPKPKGKWHQRRWRQRHAADLAVNSELMTERSNVGRKLQVASLFADEPKIFFPYQLDFRGRAYPVPLYLHPQGDDLSRALLTFAEGKPIFDQRAADWLAIHGANLFGMDKAPLPMRVAWVREHEEHILKSAHDPLAYSWWTTAGSKAWRFLAWCLEWAAFHRHGFGYESSLPIALDGTCNGLQHFSALLRDPEGGAAVNLTSSPERHDVYQEVANKTVGKLKADGSVRAERWLTIGITRDMTKPPVMTSVYGSTRYACMGGPDHVGTIEAEVRERFKEKPWPFATKAETKEACRYLGDIVWRALGETVVAARRAMDWLTQVGRLYSKANPYSIIWRTPCGFPAVQRYPELKRRQIKTRFCGSIVCPSVPEDRDEVSVREMAQGIAPNFVHSLDASHMMLTVDAARSRGLTKFAIIHDSFGTVAADTEALRDVLRSEFHRMYSQRDILGDFLRDIEAGNHGGAILPVPPQPGNLDLSEVLRSDYAFS